VNWEAVGAIGEIVAAIATVTTLVYLAIQIRHNSAVSTTGIEDAIASGFNDINLVLAGNAVLARLFNTGMYHPESLSDDEAAQFSFMFRAFINQHYRLFNLYKRGALSEERWHVYARECAALMVTPGGVLFRSGNPELGEFWAYLDTIKVENVVNTTLNRIPAGDA
jgi:hypothetical protein